MKKIKTLSILLLFSGQLLCMKDEDFSDQKQKEEYSQWEEAVANWKKRKQSEEDSMGLDGFNELGFTKLMNAAITGDTELAKQLLESGADVNIVNEFGKTANDYAIEDFKEDIVELLTAKVAQKPKNFMKDLMENLEEKHSAAAGAGGEAKAELDQDVKIGLEDFEPPKDFAPTKKKPSNLPKGKLFDIKPSLATLNYNLIEASIHGLAENAISSLDRGADVNITDMSGYTPLMYAIIHEKPDIARTFIYRGANVNASDNTGKTALMYAAYNNDIAIIKTLIQSGAAIPEDISPYSNDVQKILKEEAALALFKVEEPEEKGIFDLIDSTDDMENVGAGGN